MRTLDGGIKIWYADTIKYSGGCRRMEECRMSKWNGFFRGMAMLCLGMVIGFLISPIKQGIQISIGNNNRGSRLMNQSSGFDDEDEFDEEYMDEDDFEPDFETPDDDDEVVPF